MSIWHEWQRDCMLGAVHMVAGAYPVWHEYLRTHRPPALLPWGEHDAFFPPAGAEAYRQDLPDAEIHLLPTGHFATGTHSPQIAELILAFIGADRSD